MVDDDLKILWQTSQHLPAINIDKDALVVEIDTKLKKFDKGIRIRNRREIVVAIIIIPFFAAAAYYTEPLLARIGAALVIPSAMLIIYMLNNIKQYKKIDPSLPFLAYLYQYRNYVSKEKWLLENVLWWYILPLAIALSLFFAGTNKWEGIILLIPVNAVVYWLNRRVITKQLVPLLNHLDEQISQLKS